MSLKPFSFSPDTSVEEQLDDLTNKPTQLSFLFYSDEVIDPRDAAQSAIQILQDYFAPNRLKDVHLASYMVIDGEEIGVDVTLKSPIESAGGLN